MQWRQFAPSLFVLLLLSSMVVSFFGTLGKVALILIGSAYLLANLIASFVLSCQYGFQSFVFLPIVFMILHLSYGFGFIKGLIRFFHLWRKND